MGLSRTFEVLRGLPAPERLAFAEAALREPYPELQSAAFRALSDAGDLNRSDLVIKHYPDLLPEVKAKVGERKRGFLEVARGQVQSGGDSSRRAAYDMLASFGEIDTLPMMVQGIRDPSPAVRESVAGALEKVALRYHTHQLNWRVHGDPQSRKYLDEHRGVMLEAIEALLRAYAIHRKIIFLDIVIEWGEDTYRLVTDVILENRESLLARAFTDVLATSRSEAAVELLFRLAAEPEARLRDAGIGVLRARRDGAFASVVAAHLSHLPAERFAAEAAAAKDIPWWPSVEAAGNLPAADAARIIDFLARSGIDPDRRDGMILFFLKSRHPEVRAQALRALRVLRYPAVLDAALRSLEDASDDVRLAAARVIVDVNPPAKLKYLTPLLNATSEKLRAVATREVANASFAKYIQSFDRLDARTRELAAKALAKIDGSMVNRLSDEIGSLDSERKLKALRIIEYVGAEKDLSGPLRELMEDPDRRVRATVVKIIHLSGHVEGMKLLIGALTDPDRRVRSNAMEAFEEIGDTRYAQMLLPFLNDPDNRVRANAAKALWNLGRRDVKEVLEAMLADPDENMRISAVWALGEIRCETATQVLAGRAAEETSEKVRAKIAEVLARLAAPSQG